ncbi:MAG: FlgB family protein [Pseudomonadota bacterium]
MFKDLAILRLAEGLASHASARQRLIAENVANADTPGYVARDLPTFSAAMVTARPTQPAVASGASRPGHFEMPDIGTGMTAGVEQTPAPGSTAPNGNAVSLEDQMMRGATVKMQHDLALGVYSKSLNLLRLGLGRAR